MATLWRKLILFLLSTPHGTLGTGWLVGLHASYSTPFNSTRYIRNDIEHIWLSFCNFSFNSTRYIRNPLDAASQKWRSAAFNSTRYIRNLGSLNRSAQQSLLSTPHGTLGTGGGDEIRVEAGMSFNSTRYIRNGLCRSKDLLWRRQTFQLHTVH